MKAPTARELLENYGDLLGASAARYRELCACRKALTGESPSAPHLKRRMKRVQADYRRGQRQLRQRFALLEGLLKQLPKDEARVLSLRYLSQCSYAEISEALGFSPRHIYRLHLSGVRLLQNKL